MIRTSPDSQRKGVTNTNDNLTGELREAANGDQSALANVFASLYPDLRAMARRQLARGPRDQLLDTTALVHESFLKLIEAQRLQAEDRGHFLAYSARVMRSVVVDTVRERQAQRRGGGLAHITLNTGLIDADSGEDEILGVHDALEALGQFDERMVMVVEMRYFAGLTEAEIALALDVTERTVRRIWQRARLWLAERL